MAILETLVTLTPTAIDIAQETEAYQGFVRRIKFLLETRKWGVCLPIFGSGGVGKTTHTRILAGQTSPLDPAIAYSESIGIERQDIEHGPIPGTVIAVPGQERRIPSKWPEVAGLIQEGKAPVVLNFVAYGHHAFELSPYTLHKDCVSGMSIQQFVTAYTAKRRALEVESLKQLAALIPKFARPIHLITVVTKQDLWWRDRVQMADFYENSVGPGTYQEAVDMFRSKVGAEFQHDTIPVSLQLGNWRCGDDMLVPITEGYDQAAHIASYSKFFRHLDLALRQK